jgi:hypothetical protein
VAHDADGDVHQPVAQRLGFGDREHAVQQQRLGEATSSRVAVGTSSSQTWLRR